MAAGPVGPEVPSPTLEELGEPRGGGGAELRPGAASSASVNVSQAPSRAAGSSAGKARHHHALGCLRSPAPLKVPCFSIYFLLRTVTPDSPAVRGDWPLCLTACGSVLVAQGNGNDPEFPWFSREPTYQVLAYQGAVPSLTLLSFVVAVGSQVRAGQTRHPGAPATLCAGRGGVRAAISTSGRLVLVRFFLHREARGLREAT